LCGVDVGADVGACRCVVAKRSVVARLHPRGRMQCAPTADRQGCRRTNVAARGSRVA